MPWNLTVGDWAAIGDEVLIYNLGPVSIGNREGRQLRASIFRAGENQPGARLRERSLSRRQESDELARIAPRG